MKKKLVLLAAMLVVALLASWARPAEAVGYCSVSYCSTHPEGTCGCPPGTDRFGHTAFCGNWNQVGGCWLE